jgi:hypothetical protein
LRKIVGRTNVDAEEIANRVVVFGAIQPAGGDTTWIGWRQLVDPLELFRQPAGDGLAPMLGWLRFLLRRHLSSAQLLDDLGPAIVIVGQRGGRFE